MKSPMTMLLVAGVIGLSGCGGGADTSAQDAAAAARDREYQRQIMEWRGERFTRLTRPDGWLSLVGLHWLVPGQTYVGAAADNGTRLAVGPPQLGLLTLARDGTVRFRPNPEAGVLLNGEPATEEFEVVPDSHGAPTVVAFNKGDASFVVIERGGRYGLRVRDALAPTRTAFPGLDYFDVDPSLRFVARFEAHEPGKTIDIATMIGTIEPMANPGRLHFEKDGVAYSLEAVDEGDGQLFLIFADRTSGHQTYPAARFLYAAPAGKDGTTVLDFNKAYNPPCAFTPYSTCPMPPPENRLDLAVTAGEMKPRKPKD